MEGYAASHGNAEASKTYPTPCSSLRKGGYVMLKGHPCKIVELLTSNPGKHGHSKVRDIAHYISGSVLAKLFKYPLWVVLDCMEVLHIMYSTCQTDSSGGLATIYSKEV